MKHLSRRFCRWVALLALGAAGLSAQVTGALSGTVVDPSGAVIRGAAVELFWAQSTLVERRGVTSETGTYLFDMLRPGYYELTVSAQGFGLVRQTEIKIDAGAQTTLSPLRLAVAASAQSLEVKAAVPMIQTGSTDVSVHLSAEQFSKLPVAGRDPMTLLPTLPGIGWNGANVTERNVMNGQRVAFGNVTQDSVNVQENFLRDSGLSTLPNRLSAGQVAEVTIISSNADARFGGGSAQVIFASPSGSTGLHGSAFWLHQNNSLAAHRWLNNAAGLPETNLRNQFGGALGGGTARNRLYYYLNYEGMQDGSRVGAAGLVPTRSLRALLNPTSPKMRQILNLIPGPDVINGPQSASLGYWIFGQRDHSTTQNGFAKADYLLSPRHSFSFLFQRTVDDSDRPGSSNSLSYAPNIRSNSRATLGSGAWHWTPGAHTSNELRAAISAPSLRFDDALYGLGYRVQLPWSSNGAAQLYSDDPQNRGEKNWSLQDNFSWNRGRHLLQAGFLAGENHTSSMLADASLPTYSFDTIAGFNTGAYSLVTRDYTVHDKTWTTSPGFLRFRQQLTAGYLQDVFRLRNGFTLSLGLRYEYYAPGTETTGDAMFPAIPAGANPLPLLYDPKNPYSFSHTGASSALWQPDRNGWAPKVGFAWEPFHRARLVLRGAFGVSFVNDAILLAASRGLSFSFPSRAHTGWEPTTKDSPSIDRGDPITASFAIPANPMTALYSSASTTVDAIDPRLRTPHVQQWNFGVQREIGARWLADVRYVGNSLTHGILAPDVNFDWNRIDRSKPVQANPRVNPTVGHIYLLGNLGRSNYNALQTSLTSRFSKTLLLNVNYTWSKSIANMATTTQDRSDRGANYYWYFSNQDLNRAVTSFDTRNSLKASWAYDLPGMRGQGLVHGLTSDWTLSGVLIAQSGAPYSVLDPSHLPVGTNVTRDDLARQMELRLTGVGPTVFPRDPGALRVLPSIRGGLGLNVLNSPASCSLDLALLKKFRFTERRFVELRAEAFNAMNHTNWVVRDQTWDGKSLDGDILPMTAARRLQLALRYQF